MKKAKETREYFSIDLAQRNTGAGLLFELTRVTVADGKVVDTEVSTPNYLPIVLDTVNKEILRKLNRHD